MEEIQVASFEEFERKVEENSSEIEKLSKNKRFRYYSDPLFRGQKNSSWKLKTTLERRIKSSEYQFSEYFKKMKNVKKDIQRFIKGRRKRELNIPPLEEVYNFMIYLRHHGFPSPLLDWTSSKEVASFFAFQNSSDEKDVAIYVYFNYIGHAEAFWVGKPKIITLGPNDITLDIRHKKQASWYILSIKTIEETDRFCNIEDAMKNERYLKEKLKKYLIPSKERKKVMEKLEKAGINATTLFPDINLSPEVDSLMEKLTEKEFPLKEC